LKHHTFTYMKNIKEQKQSYKITWYSGSVEHIDYIIKEVIIQSDEQDITKIRGTQIVEGFKIYYERRILWNENKNTIDYGSYSKFVQIEKCN